MFQINKVDEPGKKAGDINISGLSVISFAKTQSNINQPQFGIRATIRHQYFSASPR